MILGKKIGSGKYRDCYKIEGGELCAKVEKPQSFVKSIIIKLLGISNEGEYAIYQSIPPELKYFFPGGYKLEDSVLICETIMDYDGSPSRKIKDTDPKDINIDFWNRLDDFIEQIIQHELWFFDMFNNIVIQRISPDESRPVMIDCKRIGYRSYPLQFILVLKSQKVRKILRRYNRIKSRNS